ncbi:MAG TPA: hypothetical protein VD926_04445, partial [Acidimicrobiales bacterium]|nr:hypothetical protein [Acidimicrobiales bacterium]
MSPLLPPDAPARRPTTLDKAVVAGLAAASAVGAVVAGGEVTGWDPADVAWRAVFGAVVVFAGAKASRWTWLFAAAVGAAAAPDLAVGAPAGIGLLVGLVNVARGRRARVVGALVVGLAAQSLLRLDLADPHGLSSLVAAVGLLPALWTAVRNARSRTRRLVAVGVGTLAVVGLGLAVAQAAAVLQARSSVATGIDAARSGFEAARAGDGAAAVRAFEVAAQAFGSANDDLSAPWAIAGRAVPLLGQHARAMAEITEAGAELAATAAGATADAPLEELGFEDGVLDLARVGAFADPLERAAAALVAADGVV